MNTCVNPDGIECECWLDQLSRLDSEMRWHAVAVEHEADELVHGPLEAMDGMNSVYASRLFGVLPLDS